MFTRRSDDELISAYIDGQLDERARRAFEARLQAEPAVRQRVETTRGLVRAAREMPPVSVPRNFTLPRDIGAPARVSRPATPNLGWKLGSALAAAVFVMVIGLDASGALAPRAATLPAAAPLSAKAIPTESTAAADTAESARVAPKLATIPTATAGSEAANSLPPNSTPAPQGTLEATPELQIQSAVVTTSTEPMTLAAGAAAPTATEPEAQSSQRLSQTEPMSITAAYGQTQTQDIAVAQVTEAPGSTTAEAAQETSVAQTPPVVPNEPTPASTWLRLIEVFMFVAAIALGVMGWRR